MLFQTIYHCLWILMGKKLTDKLYELRIRGKQEVRIIYVFRKQIIYLLHAFKKQTQKTPEKEIKIARSRLQILT